MKEVRRVASLRSAAREYCWLLDWRAGRLIREIASRDRVTIAQVRYGLTRAVLADRATSGPTAQPIAVELPANFLRPIFPPTGFSPHSPCPHDGPIPAGSRDCCMVCHRSGVDDHPALLRS